MIKCNALYSVSLQLHVCKTIAILVLKYSVEIPVLELIITLCPLQDVLFFGL